MKALILDDDPKITKLVSSLLEKYFAETFTQIDVVNTSHDALNAIKNNTYQLLLFDINLGNETSFDIIEKIQLNKSKLIFITGHEKYAIQAIKNHAVDYILKPIDLNEFKNSIQNVIDVLKKESTKIDIEAISKKQMQSLQISDINSIHIIKLNEVIYLSSDGPYTIIHLEGKPSITTSKNLKQFEEKLSESGFYRVHNSYIVNALKIKSISKRDGFMVVMSNNEHIDVSTRKKEEFLIYLSQIMDVG
jgi:two-component system, LytTR family, response regulator